MESKTSGLSAWETKDRAGLLAIETDEWREKRLLAEDPDATGAEIEVYTDTVCQELARWRSEEPLNNVPLVRANTLLLAEAIAANPNTPPRVLQRLLGWIFSRQLGERSLITKAVCRNPVLPFLLLEAPDFWTGIHSTVRRAVLREEALPPSIAHFLLRNPWYGDDNEEVIDATGTPLIHHAVADAARLHVSQGPLLQTVRDGRKAVTAFWKDYCVRELQEEPQSQDPHRLFRDDYADDWHREMVEVGLAPAWMVALYDNLPPLAPTLLSALQEDPFYDEDWYAAKPDYAPLVNPNTTPDALLQTARKWVDRKDNVIPLLLMKHPHVSAEILRHIADQKPYKELRPHLAAHSLCPPNVLIQLMDIPPKGDSREDIHTRYDALRAQNALTRRLARRHPNAPPGLLDRARRAFVAATEPLYATTGLPDTGLPLIDFAAAARGFDAGEIDTKDIALTDWVSFLIAALHVPVRDVPLDRMGRSPLDLLNHLARDGNRFIRWAAQTRLADPHFVFTWADDE